MARFTLMRDDLVTEVEDLRARVEALAELVDRVLPPEEPDPEPQVVDVLPAVEAEEAEG